MRTALVKRIMSDAKWREISALWFWTSSAGLGVLAAAIFCTICSHVALSQPVPIWTTFTTVNSDLLDDNVRAVAVGKDGALWVGMGSFAGTGGLARLNTDGQWESYTKASTKGGLPSDHITTLAVSANSTVWVGTADGLARLDRDGHWQHYTKASTKGGLPSDFITTLAVNADGALWVGCGSGVGGADGDGTVYSDSYFVRLDRGGQWQSYTKAITDAGLSPDVTALLVGVDGTLWVGTTGGLARLDRDGHWHHYTRVSTSGGLPIDEITALAVGADSALWVRTAGGLTRLDREGQWQHYTRVSTRGGLPDDRISALAVNADGTLWVGTKKGLAEFHQPSARRVRIVAVIGKIGEVSQAEHTVAAVAFDPSYLTQPSMFSYIWRIIERRPFGDQPELEIKTKSPIYNAKFDHDGAYRISVVAVDRYGNRSAPKNV